MPEEKNVEKSAREILGKELVGKDGHTVDVKKDGLNGKIRRATFDDLDAIMDINDDIYDGFDYMPALFYTFMHSKLHAIYVQEEDGKLIALINFRLHEDRDDLVSIFSVRVRASHQGRGLGSSDTSPIRLQFQRDHPMIRRVVLDTMYTPNIEAKIKKWKLLYHWNILTYKLADRQWLSRLTQKMSLGTDKPISLSLTEGTAWLERSDQLVRFVSKYVIDFFLLGQAWMPTPINKSGLRDMLSVANVFVSLDGASTVVDSSCSPSSHTPTTEDLSVEGRESESTGDRGQDGEITALSYSTVLPCKYGIKLDIFFFGDCETIFLSHVYRHLLHIASITSDDERVGVLLHFPLTIDSKNAEERLNEVVGQRMDSYAFRVTQAVQYISELRQA